MPLYTYRREDGTTFDFKQKFLDEPLNLCPTTGQKVVRVVQGASVIFKGSGFYVNDSKSASKKNLATPTSSTKDSANGSSTSGDTASTPSTPKATSTPAAAAAAE